MAICSCRCLEVTRDFSSWRSPGLDWVLCSGSPSNVRVDSAHRAHWHPSVWDHLWDFSITSIFLRCEFPFFPALLTFWLFCVFSAYFDCPNTSVFCKVPTILSYSFMVTILACLAVDLCDWILHGAFWPRPDGWLAKIARQSLSGARLA